MGSKSKNNGNSEKNNVPKEGKVHPKLHLLRDVIQLMQEAHINELDYEQGGVRIHLKKGGTVPGLEPAVSLPKAPPAVVPPAASPVLAGTEAEKTEKIEEKGVTLTSPMVGTFYRAPSPDAKPFVKEGDQVEVGQVVCIIEAMKLMNEIKAETPGRVMKILVKNGEAVEFGQPLMILDPTG